MLGALRHRNYRLFFAGQALSTVGTWLQAVALPWLVLQLTHDPFRVGITLAAQLVPMLVLGPAGAQVADRFPRRHVLLATQALYMLPATALFALAWTGTARFEPVLVAALLTGLVSVFDVPARQAFSLEMVGRDDLMNAIALNSTVFNAAAVAGPALAGLLIATGGVAACFLVNAVSFLAAIAALLGMRRLPRVVREAEPASLFGQVREGAAFARGETVVGALLAGVALVSLLTLNRLTLMPLFASRVLHTGPGGFGLLMAALGLGALAGALTLALSRVQGSGARQLLAGLALAGSLVLVALSRQELLTAALLVLAGFAQMWFLATANERIQALTPDPMRGRVMALHAQLLMGATALGAVSAGALAAVAGAPTTTAAGALVAAAVLVALRLFRPAAFTAPAR